MPMMCGGHSGARDPTPEEVQVAEAHKGDLESQLGACASFNVKKVTTQAVAGTNYQFLVDVGNGKHAYMKVFKPLPHTNEPTQLSECKEVGADHAL